MLARRFGNLRESDVGDRRVVRQHLAHRVLLHSRERLEIRAGLAAVFVVSRTGGKAVSERAHVPPLTAQNTIDVGVARQVN